MQSDVIDERSLNDYRKSEGELHIQLMKVCRNYLSELSIVSIRGILDIVKQEIVELEKATMHGVKESQFELGEKEKDNIEISNEPINGIQ